MESHKSSESVILGEDLLKSLNNYDYVKIKIKLITNNNIYGTCCKHLIPISTHPLITPYSISLPHKDFDNLRKILRSNDSFLIMKTNKNVIEISYDNYLINKISKEAIKVYRRYHIFNNRTVSNHISNDYDSIKIIMNTIAIFLTLIKNNIDILAAKQSIHKIIECREEDHEIINCLIDLILNNAGIGSGSTPSSDDFIMGFLVGIQDLINNNIKIKLLSLLKYLRTTWLSKSLIKEVLQDPTYIINLYNLYLMFSNLNHQQINEALSNTINFIRIGGFSGLFMLLGLVTGFSFKNTMLLNLWKSILSYILNI